jgi:hypothetical protein
MQHEQCCLAVQPGSPETGSVTRATAGVPVATTGIYAHRMDESALCAPLSATLVGPESAFQWPRVIMQQTGRMHRVVHMHACTPNTTSPPCLIDGISTPPQQGYKHVVSTSTSTSAACSPTLVLPDDHILNPKAFWCLTSTLLSTTACQALVVPKTRMQNSQCRHGDTSHASMCASAVQCAFNHLHD